MWMVEQQQQNFQLNLHDDLHYFLLTTTSAISQIRPFVQPPLKRNRLSSNDRHDQVDDHRAFIIAIIVFCSADIEFATL